METDKIQYHSMSEQLDKIAPALVAIQKQVKSVTMDAVNPAYRSKYATLGAVIDTLREPMAENGVSVHQPIIGFGGDVGIQTLVLHESGQWISTIAILPIKEETMRKNKRTGDYYSVDTNFGQEAGKLISYVRRYALAGFFNLYSDEDTDNNNTRQQQDNRKPARKKQSAPKQRKRAHSTNGSTGSKKPTKPVGDDDNQPAPENALDAYDALAAKAKEILPNLKTKVWDRENPPTLKRLRSEYAAVNNAINHYEATKGE